MKSTAHNDLDLLSIRNVEAKLKSDLTDYKKALLKNSVIAAVILLIVFHARIYYWAKFHFITPVQQTNVTIDVNKEPVTERYSEEEQADKVFVYKSLVNKTVIDVLPQAHYEVSGKVMHFNKTFLMIQNFYDNAAIYDLGVAWGDLADNKIIKKYLKIFSTKLPTDGNYILNVQAKPGIPLKNDYIRDHILHFKIIPANKNIMGALLTLKVNSDFEIEGDLVNMRHHNSNDKSVRRFSSRHTRFTTTKSKIFDLNCLTLYVTKIQIGNKIYK